MVLFWGDDTLHALDAADTCATHHPRRHRSPVRFVGESLQAHRLRHEAQVRRQKRGDTDGADESEVRAEDGREIDVGEQREDDVQEQEGGEGREGDELGLGTTETCRGWHGGEGSSRGRDAVLRLWTAARWRDSTERLYGATPYQRAT